MASNFTIREPGCSAWESDLKTLGAALRSRAAAENAGLRKAIIVACVDDRREFIKNPDWLADIAGRRIGATKALEIQDRGMIT